MDRTKAQHSCYDWRKEEEIRCWVTFQILTFHLTESQGIDLGKSRSNLRAEQTADDLSGEVVCRRAAPMTSPLKLSLGRFAPTPEMMRHCGTVADVATADLSQLIGRSALVIWLSTMIG